jgi:hypothetical protein
MPSSATPIACTLDAGDFRDRLNQIAALNRDALRGHRRDGLVLHLRYAAVAGDRVCEMVKREQACCGFLAFDLREEGDELRLTITAPGEARIAAEMLFDQFAAGATTAGSRVAHVALACGAGAAACAMGCVLPLALPAVVLASTGSMLAWIAGAHVWMTTIAVIAVAVAWIWIWRETVRSRARPARSTLYMMAVATFLLALALAWPLIEPKLLAVLRA